MSMCELLRRERKSLFNEDLFYLFDALETFITCVWAKPTSTGAESTDLDTFKLLTIRPSNPVQNVKDHHGKVASHSPLSLRNLQTISSQIDVMKRMATKATELLSTSKSD